MLNAVMRGSKIIDVPDFKQAKETIIQICASTAEIISDEIALTPFQVNRKRILGLIKSGSNGSNGNGGILHSLVLKKSKMRKRDFDETTQTLIEEGTITSVKEESLGRPRLKYKVVEDDEGATAEVQASRN